MLWGGVAGGALELRRLDGGRVRVAGAFPYNNPAELGRGRVEVIASRAFGARIAAGEDVHFLAQHDFAQPLASRSAGTLELRDDEDALRFEAEIDGGTSWSRDFLAAHEAGLVRGVSPGFRVAPDGERVEARGGEVRRTITAAELFELSAVTRAAYPQAQLHARSWQAGQEPHDAGLRRALNRWRA